MDENTLQFLADILVEWGSAGAVGAVLATILCRHFGKRWIDSKFAEWTLETDARLKRIEESLDLLTRDARSEWQ